MDRADKNCLLSQVFTTATRNTISLAIQDRIGEQLRTMYGDLKAEPLPERLLDLTKQLDERRSGGAS